MKILFYTLAFSLLALWGWSFLPGAVGTGMGSGLHPVRLHGPRLLIWTPARALRLPARSRKGPPVAVLPPASVTKSVRTVILESPSSAHGAPRVEVRRVSIPPPALQSAHRVANALPRSSPPAASPPPCRRLVDIVHRRWALALARRFGLSPSAVVKRRSDMRLYRVALILPDERASVRFAQRLRRLGFTQPYFRHHGGQPELSLGVFLTSAPARALVRRLVADGFKPSLEVFVRPWTNYVLELRTRRLAMAPLRRAYPGIRAEGCPS